MSADFSLEQLKLKNIKKLSKKQILILVCLLLGTSGLIYYLFYYDDKNKYEQKKIEYDSEKKTDSQYKKTSKSSSSTTRTITRTGSSSSGYRSSGYTSSSYSAPRYYSSGSRTVVVDTPRTYSTGGSNINFTAKVNDNLDKLKNANEEIENLKKTIEELEGQTGVDVSQNALDEALAKIEELKNLNTSLENEIGQSNELNTELTSNIENLNAEIVQLTSQKDELTEQKLELQERLTLVHGELTNSQETNAILTGTITALEDRFNQNDTSLREQIATLEENIISLGQEIEQKDRFIISLREQITLINSDLGAKTEELSTKETEHQEELVALGLLLDEFDRVKLEIDNIGIQVLGQDAFDLISGGAEDKIDEIGLRITEILNRVTDIDAITDQIGTIEADITSIIVNSELRTEEQIADLNLSQKIQLINELGQSFRIMTPIKEIIRESLGRDIDQNAIDEFINIINDNKDKADMLNRANETANTLLREICGDNLGDDITLDEQTSLVRKLEHIDNCIVSKLVPIEKSLLMKVRQGGRRLFCDIDLIMLEGNDRNFPDPRGDDTTCIIDTDSVSDRLSKIENASRVLLEHRNTNRDIIVGLMERISSIAAGVLKIPKTNAFSLPLNIMLTLAGSKGEDADTVLDLYERLLFEPIKNEIEELQEIVNTQPDENLEALLEKKDEQIATAEADLATAEADLATAQAELAAAQAAQATAEAAQATAEGQLVATQAELATAQAELATAQVNVATAEARITALRSQVEELETLKTSINNEVSELERRELQHKLNITELLSSLSNLAGSELGESLVENILRGETVLNENNGPLKTLIDNVKDRIRAGEDEADNLQNNLNTILVSINNNLDDIKELQEEKDDIFNDLEGISQDTQNKFTNIINRLITLDAANNQLREVNRELNTELGIQYTAIETQLLETLEATNIQDVIDFDVEDMKTRITNDELNFFQIKEILDDILEQFNVQIDEFKEIDERENQILQEFGIDNLQQLQEQLNNFLDQTEPFLLFVNLIDEDGSLSNELLSQEELTLDDILQQTASLSEDGVSLEQKLINRMTAFTRIQNGFGTLRQLILDERRFNEESIQDANDRINRLQADIQRLVQPLIEVSSSLPLFTDDVVDFVKNNDICNIATTSGDEITNLILSDLQDLINNCNGLDLTNIETLDDIINNIADVKPELLIVLIQNRINFLNNRSILADKLTTTVRELLDNVNDRKKQLRSTLLGVIQNIEQTNIHLFDFDKICQELSLISNLQNKLIQFMCSDSETKVNLENDESNAISSLKDVLVSDNENIFSDLNSSRINLFSDDDSIYIRLLDSISNNEDLKTSISSVVGLDLTSDDEDEKEVILLRFLIVKFTSIGILINNLISESLVDFANTSLVELDAERTNNQHLQEAMNILNETLVNFTNELNLNDDLSREVFTQDENDRRQRIVNEKLNQLNEISARLDTLINLNNPSTNEFAINLKSLITHINLRENDIFSLRQHITTLQNNADIIKNQIEIFNTENFDDDEIQEIIDDLGEDGEELTQNVIELCTLSAQEIDNDNLRTASIEACKFEELLKLKISALQRKAERDNIEFDTLEEESTLIDNIGNLFDSITEGLKDRNLSNLEEIEEEIALIGLKHNIDFNDSLEANVLTISNKLRAIDAKIKVMNEEIGSMQVDIQTMAKFNREIVEPSITFMFDLVNKMDRLLQILTKAFFESVDSNEVDVGGLRGETGAIFAFNNGTVLLFENRWRIAKDLFQETIQTRREALNDRLAKWSKGAISSSNCIPEPGIPPDENYVFTSNERLRIERLLGENSIIFDKLELPTNEELNCPI